MTCPAGLEERDGTGLRQNPEIGSVKLIRDRETVRRGLKKVDTRIFPECKYHNVVQDHEALKEKTPAEACGIVVEGENKGMTLIQNASQAVRTGYKNYQFLTSLISDSSER
jgi:hypothetical protein